MVKYEKVYLTMILRVDVNGKIIPLSFEWEDGRTYEIDKVLRAETAPAVNVGTVGTKRYDVMIEGREKSIYLDTATAQWFVEKKIL